MKGAIKHLLLCVGMAWLCTACGNGRQSGHMVTKEKVTHPCLLLKAGEESKIKANLKKSEELRIVEEVVFKTADAAVENEPLEREMEGKRLLAVCRQYVKELYALSYAYRMTHATKYLDAAVKRLEKASSFEDWNPSHFLDVGEMTMAMAIGYDWLYDDLPDKTREMVVEAIEKKAWDESLKGEYREWHKSIYNWNQVCNSGLVMAALALYDKRPEKAQKVLDMYYNIIRLPVGEYEPDGCYPEGFGYWAYGTGFNCMINASLYNAGFQPYETEAFLQSARFYFNMVAPSGYFYNFYDSGSEELPKAEFDPAMFYFAGRLNDASLLWWEMRHIKENPDKLGHRLLPSVLVYTKDLDMSDIPAPTQLTWSGKGMTPVYITRSGCNDPNATFFAVKGGNAFASHGHMDAGSFIFEADGERWAIDQGCEDYYTVESSGVDLWTMDQASERWDLLRYNNKYHNTITLNDEKFIVNSYSPITATFDEGDRRGAVIDMTPAYNNVKKVSRRICLFNEKILEIRDTVKPVKNSSMQWTMITTKETKVTVESDSRILLERNGKKLAVEITAPVKVTAGTWPCKSEHAYEKADATCLGFHTRLNAGQEYEFLVKLVPLTRPVSSFASRTILRDIVGE